MPTKKEDKKELRHREWAEQIAECQSSGMKIKDWCKMKDISCNTYYRRLHVVKEDIINMETQESNLESDDLQNYRMKVNYYVCQHMDNAVIKKLHTNQPLNHEDIQALEKMSFQLRRMLFHIRLWKK